VQHQGVHYDTGTTFRGPGYAISTRRTALDMSVVRRELEITRDDLHANAVRIGGSDVGRDPSSVATGTTLTLDHYADAVFSSPGRCWRMVQQAGVGAPAHCSEPVVWVGNHRSAVASRSGCGRARGTAGRSCKHQVPSSAQSQRLVSLRSRPIRASGIQPEARS